SSSQSTSYTPREGAEHCREGAEHCRLAPSPASRLPSRGLRVALLARRLRTKASSYQPPSPRDRGGIIYYKAHPLLLRPGHSRAESVLPWPSGSRSALFGRWRLPLTVARRFGSLLGCADKFDPV